MTPWIKVSSTFDDHPKTVRAGWFAKELFLFLLRLNAQIEGSGSLISSFADPAYLRLRWRYDGPVDAIEAGLVALVEAGLITRDADGSIEINGWNREEWGRPLTNAERQARHRLAKKVTESSGCYKSNAIRREEKRREIILPADISGDIGDDPQKQAKQPRDLAVTISVVDFFNRSCRAHGVDRRARVHDSHRKRIARLLRAGATELEIRLVVLWTLEGPERWGENPVLRDYLRPETLFKAQSPSGSRTFWDYLDRAREWGKTQGIALEGPGLDSKPHERGPEGKGGGEKNGR